MSLVRVACRHRVAALMLFVLGCGDDAVNVDRPGNEQSGPNVFQLSISEPVTFAAGEAASAIRSPSMVYVAFAEGELPEAVSVRISNLSAGVYGATDYSVSNGALDPVGIAAEIGDTLELSITMLDGSKGLMRAAVPTRRPPRVIRTNPPRGRTDVSVNSRIRIVFSEPIDMASVTTSSVQLFADEQVVEGTFEFEATALAVDFVPAHPLAGLTNYQLLITGAVEDLSGDQLAGPVRVEFRTEAIPDDAGTLSIVVVTSGVDQDEDGYAAIITRPGFSSLDTLSIEGKLTKTLAAGTYNVVLTNVDMNCSVTGGFYQEATVAAGANTVLNYEIVCAPRAGQRVTTQQIAFVSNRDGNSEIYAMNADGTDLIRLTSNAAEDYDPAWSPDGKHIAFISDRSGRPELHIMAANGSGVFQRTGGGYAGSPAWSPDGGAIAYEGLCDGQGCILMISSLADNGESGKIGHPYGWNGQPAFAPDGREFAFVSDWSAFDFVFEVYTSDFHTITKLTDGWDYYPRGPGNQLQPAYFWHPTYARDGRLAMLQHHPYFGTRDQPPFLEDVKLVLWNKDGTFTDIASAGQISRFAAWSPHSFAWSPDGTKIALTYSTCSGDAAENCSYSIVVVNADGTNPTTLLTNAHSPTWR